MSILCACDTSSIESPILASTTTRCPPGFTNVIFTVPLPPEGAADACLAQAAADARGSQQRGDAARTVRSANMVGVGCGARGESVKSGC